jgi:chemotaxis protein CheX
MGFSDADLAEVTERIWSSILGLELELAPPNGNGDNRYFTGCVQITGEWEGAITIACSEHLARRATSIMFETPADEASFEEVQDAVGELTNMLGGNLKVLLPQPSQMSLPAVIEGSDYKFMVPSTSVMNEVGFNSAGHSLRISVLQKNAA